MYLDYNYDFGNKEEGAAAEMMVIERPRGLLHLFSTLYSLNELRLLKLCNADGYFYLLYLKSCAWMFGISKFCYSNRLMLYSVNN
jgi:hypothetical protein